MTHLRKFITLASLSTILSQSAPPTHLTESAIVDDSTGTPARAMPSTNTDRVQRKPAVEPRVYVEDLTTKSGYVYYDYTDQAHTREQRPPEPTK